MSETGDVVLAVASRLPVFGLRMVVSLFGILLRIRRGRSAFHRTLKRRGMDPEMVKKLTGVYRRQTSIRGFIRMAIKAARNIPKLESSVQG